MNEARTAEPYRFDEFFNSGLEESVSPFLTHESRRWARHIPLKASLASALFLVLAFGLSFISTLVPLSWLFLAQVYFFAGVPKLIDAIEDILNLEINIDVLMTLAAFLTILVGSPMEGGLLLVLFAVSGGIEKSVTSRAKSAVRALHHLTPSVALQLDEKGNVRQRHVRDVSRGSKILIRAGDVVPLDGVVVSGASSVTLAHLTGENLPQRKEVGDRVPAGANNGEGALTLEVTHTSSDSTVARIIKLITQAQEARPRFQRWLDRAGGVYALSIISLSCLLALVFPWITAMPYLGDDGSIYRALAFLIAASPCALIIALPIAYLSAISACARNGALLKGGIVLDALASCSTIAFDKTGTLTTGELEYLGIESVGPCTDPHDMSLAFAAAAALERHAVHPIAAAVVRAYPDSPPVVEGFRSIAGYGVEGTIVTAAGPVYSYVGHPDYLGNRLTSQQLQLQRERAETLRQAGQLVSVVLYRNSLFLLRFQDTPRPGIRNSLSQLRRQLKLRLVMLSGDHEATARQVAEKLEIEEWYADLRPEDKLQRVATLSKMGGLAMVGDGINDAPALARATVGISMGKVGSHTAVEASDVVLLHDNLNLLPWLWRKAQQTTRVVRQNVILASLALLGASFAALIGLVPLWLAVTLHEGGTVLVGLNSLRLLRSKNLSHN